MIEAEARELGRIFLGEDDRFDAQPWNKSSRLEALLRYLRRTTPSSRQKLAVSVPASHAHRDDPSCSANVGRYASTVANTL